MTERRGEDDQEKRSCLLLPAASWPSPCFGLRATEPIKKYVLGLKTLHWFRGFEEKRMTKNILRGFRKKRMTEKSLQVHFGVSSVGPGDAHRTAQADIS